MGRYKYKNNAKLIKNGNESGGYKEYDNNDNDQAKKKIKLNKVAFFVVLSIFIIFMCVSVILNVVFIVKYNEIKKYINVSIFNDVELQIKRNGSVTGAVTLVHNVVDGVKYKQKFTLNTLSLDTPQVIRAKAYLYNSDEKVFDINFENLNGWYLGEDGYYYFNYVVYENKLIDICKYITLPANLTTDKTATNQHIILMTIESLDYSPKYATNLWKSAPSEWIINDI